jgi:WD40 repeat protein/tRNA A-37 threonylcarbamoyl transferase component Bud32
MGRVYVGQQESPARLVAVKVLRDGLSSQAVVRRFEHEGQFLARLRHPGIAQIFAAGVQATPAGDVPYFVMELVADAVTITDFVRMRPLAMHDRVRLFASAAAAVAHAHREGVVHRDLKPGNILVDATGDTKVIDFGVARAIDSSDDRLTAAADLGQLLGTVRYMAPEQLGVGQGEADARSDVYAMGLVLHELLLDALPYELGGRSLVEAAALLGARSGGEARAISRRLRASGLVADESAPLAAIIGTCLEPRPADRYQNGRDLAADLERWLAGQPIHARPPTLVESIVRLARRHRGAAVAAVTVFAAMLIMLGAVAWSWRTAEAQRRIATSATVAANDARVTAEQQRAEADARATEVRRQLYFSTVLLAAEARDRDNLAEARRLLAEARELAPGVATHPIELDYLAASLDESVATLDVDAGTVTAIAMANNGTTVAAATEEGRVLVWRHGTPPLTIATMEGRVWAVAFSPDGSCVAIGTSDGSFCVHDAATGLQVASVEAHDGTLYGLAFSSDGLLLATASRDRCVRLWDTQTWKRQGHMTGHDGTVLSVVFAPDDRRLLTTSSDGTARIWQIADGFEVLRIDAGSGRVFRGAFSPDGSRVATAGEDGHARLWNIEDGRLLGDMLHPHRVNAVAFAGDGSQLVTGSGDAVLRCWDLETSRVVARRRGHADSIWSLAVQPLGRDRGGPTDAAPTVVTGSSDTTVRLWDLGSAGEPVVPLGDRGLAVAVSPTEDVLAVSTANGEVILLDPATLREYTRLTGLTERVNALSFSPDGVLLAAVDDSGALHRWRFPAATPLEPVSIHTRRGFDVCFSPDGHLIATAGEDRSARLLDAATGADLVPPLKHPSRVFRATFDPDGRRLATACEDRNVRLWDVSTGKALSVLSGHTRPVNWVCFSPDGKRLASASSDGTVRLWDLAATDDPPQPMVLTGPSGQIWKVAFSPDGSRIAATAADGLVQLWDAASGRPVSVLRGHRDATWGLAFLHGGHVLATASWDGTLRLWGVPMATIAAAREAAE